MFVCFCFLSFPNEASVNPWHKTLGQHSARQKSSHASCASRPMPHSTCATPNTRLRACQRCSQTWCFPCFILAHYISIVLTPRVRTESKEQATIPEANWQVRQVSIQTTTHVIVATSENVCSHSTWEGKESAGVGKIKAIAS